MIKLGDKVRMRPTVEGGTMGHAGQGKEMTGTVVYIHPKHRHYVLEFMDAKGFRWRESFQYPRSRSEE